MNDEANLSGAKMSASSSPGALTQIKTALNEFNRAEFDSYAEDYNAGMGNPIKRIVGPSAAAFVELKARWFMRDMARESGDESLSDSRVLDFGCGVGTLMRLLPDMGFRGQVGGCDISEGMLRKAVALWGDRALHPLTVVDSTALPYPDGTFDAVVASAVFHHVDHAIRPATFGELARILRPGGKLYVFEHNPFNLITRWVVSSTPIDYDAVLLAPLEVRRSIQSAGLADLRTGFLLFAPITWGVNGWLERHASWLPLGGQYVVVGAKPAR